MTLATRVQVREHGAPGAHEAVGPGRFRIRIIRAGQGTSGLYPAEVLERDGPKVFRAGTLMFIDHPGRSEESDRPERSVRDLAGKLVTDAEYRDGALFAEAEVFPSWRPLVEELADTIGVSIRGYGEADGDGTITALTAAESVDFVTRAGAGGKVLELIEAARRDAPTTAAVSDELSEALTRLEEARNVGAWLESRLHLSFTQQADELYGEGYLTRDERIALSSAIGDALDAFRARLEDTAAGLYDRDPFVTPDTTATVTEGRPPSEEDIMSTPQELAAELARTRRALHERDARDLARQTINDSSHPLTEAAAERVIENVLRSLPVTSAGDLDREAFATRVDEAAAAEAAYLAEAAGPPAVRGLGEGRVPNLSDDELREANQKRAEELAKLWRS